MKPIIKILSGLSLAIFAAPSIAALNIFACEQEWAALAQELAGDKASVYSATTALQDVHKVEARPSLILQTPTYTKHVEIRFASVGERRYRAGNSRLLRSRVFQSSCTIKTCRISSTGRECAKREASNPSPACRRRLRISPSWWSA